MAQNSLVSSSPLSTDQKKIILDLEINDKQVVNTIIEAQKALASLTTEEKKLKQVIKDGSATQEQRERYVVLKTEINDLNNTIRANQKVLDEQIKKEKNNGDSINAMRAQLKLLRAEYEDMPAEKRVAPEIGQKQLQEIEELTQAIKDAEYAQLDFRRNVGNYPEAGNAKQALRELRVECQNLAVALSSIEGKRQAQAAVINSLAQSVGRESQEYKDAVNELNQLNAAYTETQENLRNVEQEAGKLSDVLSDSNKRIQSFANDQQRIAAMQEGVNALTSAYTLLQGSMAALGLQSKALLEVYAKIQIVQQSINALMTIYKTLNKDSNLMIVLRNKLEQTRLVWTKAYNAALTKQNVEVVKNTAAETANAAAVTATTVAETGATVATFSLRAALEALKVTLLSNPFTAILLGITTAVVGIGTAVSKLIKKNKEAEKSEEELAEAAKKTSEEYKKSVDKRISSINTSSRSYTEQIAKVKSLMSVLKSETAAYSAKQKAMDELNRLVPQYNGHLSKTGEIISANSAAIDKYIKDLERQAEATATMNALISAYEEKIESGRRKAQNDADIQNYQKRIDEAQAMIDMQNSLDARFRDYETLMRAQKNLDDYTNKLNAAKEAAKEASAEIANAEKEIEYFASHAKDLNVQQAGSGSTTSTKENPRLKQAQDSYNELIKLAQDYYKSLEDIQKASIKTLTDKENARYAGERAQLEKALVDAQKLIDIYNKEPKLFKELQKNNPYLSLESLNGQIQILNTELDNAEKRHIANIEKINNDTNAAFTNILNKLQMDLDKVSENATVRYTAQLKDRLATLDAELKRELELHEYTEEQKAAITAKYEEKKAQVLKEFGASGSGGKYSNTGNVNVLKEQLAADLAELDARQAAELAAFEGTEAQKAEIVARYAQKRVQYEKEASKQEQKIWTDSVMMIAQSLNSAMQGMTDLFNVMAEDNAEMQKYSKELAMGQIILSAAIATAQAVVAAINAGKDTGIGAAIAIPLFLLEFTGIVAGVIAQAKSTLSQAGGTSKPKFATGGIVGNGKKFTSSDQIDAKLSEGEYVIQSKIVKKYGVDFFDNLNETPKRKIAGVPLRFATGGSVPSLQTMQYVESQMDYTQMEAMFTNVVEKIQPVVSVQEITTKQNRVKIKQDAASYK